MAAILTFSGLLPPQLGSGMSGGDHPAGLSQGQALSGDPDCTQSKRCPRRRVQLGDLADPADRHWNGGAVTKHIPDTQSAIISRHQETPVFGFYGKGPAIKDITIPHLGSPTTAECRPVLRTQHTGR